MTSIDWIAGVFLTAVAWAGLLRVLQRAARQHDAAERRELRRAAERAGGRWGD